MNSESNSIAKLLLKTPFLITSSSFLGYHLVTCFATNINLIHSENRMKAAKGNERCCLRNVYVQLLNTLRYYSLPQDRKNTKAKDLARLLLLELMDPRADSIELNSSPYLLSRPGSYTGSAFTLPTHPSAVFEHLRMPFEAFLLQHWFWHCLLSKHFSPILRLEVLVMV